MLGTSFPPKSALSQVGKRGRSFGEEPAPNPAVGIGGGTTGYSFETNMKRVKLI
jgi:hypothetical protein